MSEILTLHEELLRKIRDVLPNSDLRSDVDHRNSFTSAARHARQPSAERPRPLAGPVSTLTHGSFELSKIEYSRKCALVSEPREVALVAKVFDKMVKSTLAHSLSKRLIKSVKTQLSRFFAYEEYSAEYESSKRDMIIISNSIPNWHAYERGIEALANSLAPGRKEDAYNRKSLAFKDLLIKVWSMRGDQGADSNGTYSQYSGFANTHSSFLICTSRHRSWIARMRMQRLKRSNLGWMKPCKRSTQLRTIRRRVRISREHGNCRIY